MPLVSFVHEQSDGTTLWIMEWNYPFYFHKTCFSVTYAKWNNKGSTEESYYGCLVSTSLG